MEHKSRRTLECEHRDVYVDCSRQHLSLFRFVVVVDPFTLCLGHTSGDSDIQRPAEGHRNLLLGTQWVDPSLSTRMPSPFAARVT